MTTNPLPDFSQENLDALNRAIAMGIRQVSFGSRIVLYRSLDEMMSIRRLMKQELRRAAGQASERKQTRIVTRKGF